MIVYSLTYEGNQQKEFIPNNVNKSSCNSRHSINSMTGSARQYSNTVKN